MTRRGRWAFDPAEKAWLLDGSDWWLQYERAGWRSCSYCWQLPPGRWRLWRSAPPSAQLHKYTPQCTHRAYLRDAMPAAEGAYGKVIMQSLAAL
jgi:hypothetical protein